MGSRTTIITCQLPPAAWHAWLGELTLADAILDRVVHSAYKIAIKDESMRRSRANAANAAGVKEAAMAEDICQGG